DSGALGTGDHQGGGTPRPVPGLTGVAAVAAGADRSCALLESGSVQCWGVDADGFHGSPPSAQPVPVAALSDITDVAVGDGHACAAARSGAITCWGNSVSGALGAGASWVQTRPV